ncbi:hypothetical protein PR048_002053, partial [Dryococelus australis]
MGDIQGFVGKIRMDTRVELCQHKIIEKMLEWFNVEECKTCLIPMEDRIEVRDTGAVVDVPFRKLVGSFSYISQISRSNTTFETSYLSWFLDYPTRSVWNAAKRALSYLKGRMGSNVIYKNAQKNMTKSLSMQIQTEKCSGALSSAGVEYIAGSLAATELLYLKDLLSKFVGST